MEQHLSTILTFIAIAVNLIGIGIFVGSNNEFKEYVKNSSNNCEFNHGDFLNLLKILKNEG